eukprot:gnl/Spiro4/4455_TR2219_c0_g1_i1.p2 gnl/Spiro4/4455_TR2219_c0_g1~~gnl/Spiro4/4455_TR2219_c0_g1_i1.p2  ORF type:complete len:250 (-),score=14.89 gnl/Spiro4/4455_TR2219_c0_g1_i1:126-875(-)
MEQRNQPMSQLQQEMTHQVQISCSQKKSSRPRTKRSPGLAPLVLVIAAVASVLLLMFLIELQMPYPLLAPADPAVSQHPLYHLCGSTAEISKLRNYGTRDQSTSWCRAHYYYAEARHSFADRDYKGAYTWGMKALEQFASLRHPHAYAHALVGDACSQFANITCVDYHYKKAYSIKGLNKHEAKPIGSVHDHLEPPYPQHHIQRVIQERAKARSHEIAEKERTFREKGLPQLASRSSVPTEQAIRPIYA